MRSLLLSTLLLGLVFLNSCKKNSDDTGNPNNALIGNYKLFSVSASTIAIRVIDDGSTVEKTITTSNYTSTNNTGTLAIDANNMTSKDLSYSASTIAHADFYEDGILYDTEELPFAVDVPASSATSAYKVITSDSLYFPAGSALFGGATTATVADGAKYVITGDKLIMTGSTVRTSAMTQSGYLVNTEDHVSYSVTYQKQ